MLRQGYWLFEFISISEILLKARVHYGMSFLFSETDENDLTYFLIYQAEVIQRAIDALHRYIEKKSSELRVTESFLKNTHSLNHRQQGLLSHALRHPGMRYTIEGHRRSHAVVYDTARKDLLELNRLEFLTLRRVGKAFVFVVPTDIAERVQKGGPTPLPLN